MAESEIIAGLDLGTTKVCAIVAEQTDDGIDIIGVGSVPREGLQEGRRRQHRGDGAGDQRGAIEQAETMAGVEINTVYAGIAGSHVRGHQQGRRRRDPEPRGHRRTTSSACSSRPRRSRSTSDRQVLHVLPQEYIVDDQDGIQEPIGMSGVRLEARVHLVTAATTSVQNIIKCAERCDLHVAEVVLEPLASADAVLSEDEKEIGVVLDRHRRRHDRHHHLRRRRGRAHERDPDRRHQPHERHRDRPAHADGRGRAHQDQVRLRVVVDGRPGRDDRGAQRRRRVSRACCRASVLCEIIEPRVEEIFAACRHVDRGDRLRATCSRAGVVITGGTTLLDGMPELAEQVLGLPVRRGMPTGVGGLIDVVRSPAVRDRRRPREVRRRAASCVGAAAEDRGCRQSSCRGPSVAGWRRWFREVF